MGAPMVAIAERERRRGCRCRTWCTGSNRSPRRNTGTASSNRAAPPFPGRVWERNYYEHIIRNQESLERIRAYIETKPQRWALDREKPQRIGLDDLESWIYDQARREEG